MQNKEILLEVKHLRTSFFTPEGEIKAVNDVSYHVNRQEVVAVVGESGCGKSITQMSVMQLVQSPPGKILSGEAVFEGEDILKWDRNSKEMREFRGAKISMIFQEPMTSLNPVFTIGQQLVEVICLHKKVSKKDAWQVGIDALKDVGIPDAEARMKNYPFQMSGGMRQRVLIAIAVACGSKMIIADEPTTALDVTTQAQVMELLKELVDKKGVSILMVTHNLGLVTRYADRVYVMYAGRIVESGTTEDILMHPKHPYTEGLLKSVPRMDLSEEEDLVPIKGTPPLLAHLPDYCAFYPRCPYASEQCRQDGIPELKCVGENEHFCACLRRESQVNGRE